MIERGAIKEIAGPVAMSIAGLSLAAGGLYAALHYEVVPNVARGLDRAAEAPIAQAEAVPAQPLQPVETGTTAADYAREGVVLAGGIGVTAWGGLVGKWMWRQHHYKMPVVEQCRLSPKEGLQFARIQAREDVNIELDDKSL